MEKFCPVPGCRVDHVTRLSPQAVDVLVHGTREEARCPGCRHVSRAVHSRYVRRPGDLPAFGRTVRLRLQVRRFYCPNTACPKRTFAERFPKLLAPRAQRTRRLATSQARVGAALGGEPSARLLPHLGMPASADTVLRLIHTTRPRPTEPPRVLGVDDWALKKGRTYGTILVDLERRRVVDLLPDRTAETLAAWRRRRPGIEVIARDRSTEYARAATLGAPKATQVADRWHLLLNTRQMVERWLADAHARLRRLPALAGEAGAAPATRRSRAFPRSRAEAAASADSRARWQAIYNEVRRRHAGGASLLRISRQMGLARGTVRKFAHAESFPERVPRVPGRSMLDPYLEHLSARVAAGCENGLALWRELQRLGYPGTSRQVHRWLAERRTKPGKARSAAPTAAGPSRVAPSLPPPKQLAWRLVGSPAAPDPEGAGLLARLAQDPEAAKVIELARAFVGIVRRGRLGQPGDRHETIADLAAWLAEARACGVPVVATFAAGLEQDGPAVRAALTLPWSSGQAEGQITRLKLVKRSMYGRASFDLLRRRVLLAA